MNLLQRRIFTSVLFACAVGVGLFAFVLTIGNVVKDLLGYVVAGQMESGMFLELLALIPPAVLPYALPVGILTGVLLVLGRLSADHEITAMRASGLSLGWIARPILLLGVLGALTAIFINFQFFPWAKVTYEVQLADAARTNPLSFIVPRTFIRVFPDKVLYVGEREGQSVKDFWLWDLDRRGRARTFVRAKTGSFYLDEANSRLVLNLADVHVEARDQKNPEDFSIPRPSLSFERTSYPLPLTNLFGRVSFHPKLQWLSYPALLAEWRRLAEPVAPAEQRQRELARMKLQMVVQNKFASAFAAFSFALIGVPLGIRVSRSETSANLGLAVVLALSYYFLTIVVGWLENQPDLRPDLLLWVPNLLFLGAGIWMFWRVDRQ